MLSRAWLSVEQAIKVIHRANYPQMAGADVDNRGGLWKAIRARIWATIRTEKAVVSRQWERSILTTDDC